MFRTSGITPVDGDEAGAPPGRQEKGWGPESAPQGNSPAVSGSLANQGPGDGWMELGRERQSAVSRSPPEGRGCSRYGGDDSLHAAGAGRRLGPHWGLGAALVTNQAEIW